MTLLRPLALLLFAAFTSAPAYAADLRLEDFFKGKTYAYGSFGAINGTSRSFRVDLTGHVRGKVLTLREDFRYDDGERDTKTWVFTRTGPNTYSGTREDVLGETTVRLSGNTARFTYRVDLNPGGKPNIVRFHDKLVLKDDGTLRNTALVTKFLLPVARVKVNFAPTLAGAQAIKP
ncbi:DUF3833 family protein [Hoeflea alexandrii]|jgi:hypothetical protein|uniref:DUF3833 family protein n=1 Tax=Hoeflea alexandrii TaxID=288436 RepID=A0ABT1CRQ5_9HYPH|nr:DUF3833 family protein [Hoeflea alexandrii]MBV6648481.1 DUF3833 family protein [Hoeflea sp.]MCO6408608.1 DUF3833 family protein [Hoeflea alexandrii]MCY0151292.1 DUF3833 domain-containing protein [Hoeflea alexandrii]